MWLMYNFGHVLHESRKGKSSGQIGTVHYNWPMSAHVTGLQHSVLYRFGRFAQERYPYFFCMDIETDQEENLTIKMWRSSNSNSTTFELRTFSTDLKFDECVLSVLLLKANSWILVLRLISYAQRARECRQTSFFLKFNLSHKLQLLNVQHNFCSVG